MMVLRPSRPSIVRALPYALALVPCVVSAQLHRTELSVSGRLMATDNGALAPEGSERSDLLTSIRPAVRLSRQGAGLALSADLAADLVASAENTRRDRILPDARAAAALTLVEQVLFVEAAGDVRQVEEDVFGARVVEGTASNTRTVGTLRLSPHVAVALSPRVSAHARLDGTWTRYKDTLAGDSRTRIVSSRLEAKPQPFGWLLEASQEKTDFRDAIATDLEVGRATATATALLGGDWVVGVAAGRERADIGGHVKSDTAYGLRLSWIPGPRTDVALAVDERFFGNGWSISARHRTPRMSFALSGKREPTAAGTGARGDGLAAFLDAILTTRNPDPIERAGAVDTLVAERGLPAALPGSIGTVAAYPQLRTAANATFVYLGPRTTVSVNLYAERRVRLQGARTAVAGDAPDDSQQAGASVGWNHRLTTQSTLDVGAAYSRIEGLAARSGDQSQEASLRLNLVRNLSPRMNATLGVGARRLRTNVSTDVSFDERNAFAGLAYRF